MCVQAVADIAVQPASGPAASVQGTALFSLGNMANHSDMVHEMVRLGLEPKLVQLMQSRSGDVLKNARRLHAKLQASMEEVQGSSNGEAPSDAGGAEAAAAQMQQLGLQGAHLASRPQ